MAYDDGYYYGQCKIVAVVDNTADNGKTVLITTDDNKTYSSTIANKRCEFLLPPRTLYTVQKVSSGSAEFTTKVEAGYGDCILVHLDTGYVEVKQGDIVGLDYIKAATDANLKNKVPEAKAVKKLNNSFGGLKFAQDSEGNWGYIPSGADTVVPFKSGISMENAIFTFGNCGAYANNVHRTELTLTRTLTVPNGYKKLYITCNFGQAFTNFNWSVVSYSASGAITSSKIIYQPVSGNMSECIIECDVTPNANITFALYTNTETLSHMLCNLPCGFIFTK